MEQKEITKTRLIIYVRMAYGLTCLMGILMWYGSTKGYDLTVFPTAQMMYPAAGLTRQNWKSAVLIVLVFVGIYIVRTVVSVAVQGVADGSGMQYVKEWIAMFQNPVMWINIVELPINYFFVFIAFFGEEYGWRYYLQPVLQKRFGLRAGVIVLGVVWGLWHIPDDLFYYTQTSGIQMIFAQQITCISLGIFFAYAYMKTQNIWVTVCLHYLNNNLIPIISGTLSADVLENQNVSWRDLPVAVVLNGLCFGFFLLADVFKKKEIEKENS